MINAIKKNLVKGALFIPFAVLITANVALSGCSTTSTIDDANNAEPAIDYDEFYDGESELIYANKEFPEADAEDLKTAGEIIAIGDAALYKGDLDEALYQYVKAIDRDHSSYIALYKIGGMHSKRGNVDKAKRAYAMAIVLKPEHGPSHEGLAMLFLSERKYEAARDHLIRAEVNGVAISWQIYNSLGVLSDLDKDYKQAIIYYQKALDIKPELSIILNNIGYSRYMLGDWDDAEVHFKKAVLHDRTFKRAWRNLGLLHARKGNYGAAIDTFTKVENLHEAYNDIGFICMMDGKYEISEAFFNRAIKLSPRYFEAANNNLQRNRLLSHKKNKF